MAEPVKIAEDRTMIVPAGKIVKTGYVKVENVRLACRARMAVGDVAAAYQRVLQYSGGGQQAWPCPTGYWEDATRFVIQDGRHEYVASIMLGLEYILVAWIDSAD